EVRMDVRNDRDAHLDRDLCALLLVLYQLPQLREPLFIDELEAQAHAGRASIAVGARPDHRRRRLDGVLTAEADHGLRALGQRSGRSQEQPSLREVANARVDRDVLALAPASQLRWYPRVLAVFD